MSRIILFLAFCINFFNSFNSPPCACSHYFRGQTIAIPVIMEQCQKCGETRVYELAAFFDDSAVLSALKEIKGKRIR